jgi:type VI secretion system protein ImpA
MTQVLDFDALLTPVSGDNPAGVDSRWTEIYDELVMMRRLATDTIRITVTEGGEGPDTPERWREVERLAVNTLATSKHLQVAVWLLEAETHLHRFAGAAAGVKLVRELIERFWDHLYPLPDPDDDEPLAHRAAILGWVTGKLPELLRAFPLTNGDAEYALCHYDFLQEPPSAFRDMCLENGWPTREMFQTAVTNSGRDGLQATLEQVAACHEQVKLLAAAVAAKFVDETKSGDDVEDEERPLSFERLEKVLEGCRQLLERAIA